MKKTGALALGEGIHLRSNRHVLLIVELRDVGDGRSTVVMCLAASALAAAAAETPGASCAANVVLLLLAVCVAYPEAARGRQKKRKGKGVWRAGGFLAVQQPVLVSSTIV